MHSMIVLTAEKTLQSQKDILLSASDMRIAPGLAMGSLPENVMFSTFSPN